VWIAPAPNTPLEEVYKFADVLRSKQVNVGVDISGRKIGDMIQGAEKRSIPLLIVLGEEELKTKQYKVRRLKDRVEKEARPDNIVQVINELKSGN
jgi:threonyl-tRNA synthetase